MGTMAHENRVVNVGNGICAPIAGAGQPVPCLPGGNGCGPLQTRPVTKTFPGPWMNCERCGRTAADRRLPPGLVRRLPSRKSPSAGQYLAGRVTSCTPTTAGERAATSWCLEDMADRSLFIMAVRWGGRVTKPLG